MADRCEPENKSANSKKKVQQPKLSKTSAARKGKTTQSKSSRAGTQHSNQNQTDTASESTSASSSHPHADQLPVPPAKRKRVDKFSQPPVPGTRAGLRSQDKPSSIEQGTDPRWVVASVPSTSKAPTAVHKAATPSTSKTSSKSPGKASKTASAANTSTGSKKGPKSEKNTKINTSESAATSSGARTSASVSSVTDTSVSLGSGSRKRNKETSTKAVKAKRRRESKKSARKQEANASLASTSQPSSSLRATKAGTTGETGSKVKRSAEGSTSAAGADLAGGSGGATGSCASAQGSSRRRSRGGSNAAASGTPTSATGGRGGASAAPTSDPSGAVGGESQANPTGMSTSGGNGSSNAGGSGSAGGAGGGSNEDLPAGLQAMTGSMLSELLLGSASEGGGATGGAAGASSDSSSSAALDPEMHRLQAMLEARGVPPHLFGALGSSMRHILHRSMNTGAMGKVQSLIKGMQAKEDEGQQLTAVMEMCQVLVMGNEDSLAGFPVKQVVPELVSLLHMEHNFDIMNHACRALTYMLEALPRSSPMVVEAVPALLDKLKCIQCMDVAEQSLTALDMLSKRHNKNLLQAGAISACLMYLDFFSTAAQRSALAVAANCCNNITPEEFHYVRESLPLLSGKLLTADKKSVESVCTCFARLVDNLHHDEKLLKQLAAHEMLANILKLLEVAPPVISSPTFTMVIRMFVIMCTHCTELAVCLLRQSVSNTLVYLLCGQQSATTTPTNNIELVPRSPQELYEIVSLIGELMPALPATGLFSVDSLLKKHPSLTLGEEEVTWQWKDDKGNWKAYSPMDSRIVEAAYEASEEEVSLSAMGRMYTVDFSMMQQINEETGTTRPVFRSTDSGVHKRMSGTSSNTSAAQSAIRPDARAEVLAEQPELATNFIKSLFGILYEVYSSSAGPAVRHKCLQAILRQIYYASPQLLYDVLNNQPVSSHIASMLASQDHKVVVGALQMADILMRKLPDTFTQFFQRQGVTHQIKRLATAGAPGASTSTAISSDTPVSKRTAEGKSESKNKSASKNAGSTEKLSSTDSIVKKEEASAASSSPAGSSRPDGTPPGSAAGGKQKRASKRALRTKARSNTAESQSGDSSTPSGASARPKSSNKKDTSSNSPAGKLTKASFLASLHPSRWGNRGGASADKSGGSSSSADSKAVSTAALIANYREKVKGWITTRASEFMTEHFSQLNMSAMKAEGVLQTLCNAAKQLHGTDRGENSLQQDREALESIANAVKNDDVSPFELIHSGVIEKLLTYLTASTEISSSSTTISDLFLPHEQRLTMFMSVFIGSPVDPNTKFNRMDLTEECRLQFLVYKTMSCLHQQEQFQVKVHDLGMGGGNSSTNAMKFFSTHQLKCQLQRHPDCKQLKQWKGGAVKVDPLALVQAIERYLIIRGYCKTKSTGGDSGSTSSNTPAGGAAATGGSSTNGGAASGLPVTPGSQTSDNTTDLENISDDGDSEDELDDSMAAMLMAQSSGRHKLEFLIGDKVLPYNMTVYQAVRNHSVIDSTEQENESDHGLGGSSIWTQTHLIWYRQAADNVTVSKTPTTSSSSSGATSKKTRADSGGKSTRGSAKSRKSNDFFIDGVVGARVSPLLSALTTRATDKLSIKDSSIESLALIRALHTINTYWGSLYHMYAYKPVVAETDFISTKLTAKANRQLQDPLVIMTGNIPQWLPQVAGCCPFLFPFETRQMLFYVCSFDRDRAMMRLQESGSDTHDSDTSSRVAPPRLEKKKRTVSRENILKQAETILNDVGNSKALLEIQYENEVGTGLGPTLEFYSLVCKELQASDLDIWHGQSDELQQKDGESRSYMKTAYGLYPIPLARNAKSGLVTKIKSKFKFMGKLLAKALMDSRILDLPLSPIVYSWLLGQQKSLIPSDLAAFDQSIATSYTQLKTMSDRAKDIRNNTELTSSEERDTQISSIGIEDLCLDFTLPGYEHIQLKKGGKDENVTADNIDEYLELLCHWIFSEGIYRQMEALKEGFDSVFSSAQLSDLFSAHELEQLFCGNITAQWDTKDLYDCCRADHGYTMDSKTVHNLFEVLSSYDADEQRKFLSFVTGSPRLPVGGFRSLNPPLTIVRKTLDASENTDDFLPSVMTCVNYLKLPDYSDIEIMKSKIKIAATIGQLSFHLS